MLDFELLLCINLLRDFFLIFYSFSPLLFPLYFIQLENMLVFVYNFPILCCQPLNRLAVHESSIFCIDLFNIVRMSKEFLLLLQSLLHFQTSFRNLLLHLLIIFNPQLIRKSFPFIIQEQLLLKVHRQQILLCYSVRKPFGLDFYFFRYRRSRFLSFYNWFYLPLGKIVELLFINFKQLFRHYILH